MRTRALISSAAAWLVGLAVATLAGGCGSPSSSPSPDAPWPPLADGEAAVLFAGDVFLGAHVAGVMKEKGDAWPAARLGPLLREASAAAVIGNHEGVIGSGAGLKKTGPNKWNYVAAPRTARLLADAGFTHLGLANNHTLDRGPAGLASTREALAGAGLETFGAGTRTEAYAPVVVRAGGVRVAVLPGMNAWRQYREAGWRATEDEPGIALFDPEAFAARVAAARDLADVVVLYPHWGPEYKGVVSHQKRWADRAVEAGVDLVVGHHSHQAQPIEVRARVPILWNLGNTLFGTDGRFKKGQGQGLLARLVVAEKRIARVEVRALAVDNEQTGYQPHPLPEDEARALLRTLGPEVPWRFEGAVGVLDVTP